ncbi:hypothetical protein TNCV_253781 [Trichonephila clavipes]|nr:hypothetical protein TNCV_253781 [Trichonephila clavipes]
MPEALSSALGSQHLMQGHPFLLDLLCSGSFKSAVSKSGSWDVTGLRRILLLQHIPLKSHTFEVVQHLAYQLSEESAERLIKCMGTANGLCSFLSNQYLWSEGVSYRSNNCQHGELVTKSHGYSKLHCTFSPHPHCSHTRSHTEQESRHTFEGSLFILFIYFHSEGKEVSCFYNRADGSLMGCKSHFTTNLTKVVGVINTVPWHSDLNAKKMENFR